MNLRCRLGFHAPFSAPRWNDGYYFGTCRRCGRDIIRTAYERWHVPQGYRVVWTETAPADRPQVGLTREAPPTPAPARRSPEEAAREEPAREEPVGEEPAREELVREDLVREEPVGEEPVREEPLRAEPVREEQPAADPQPIDAPPAAPPLPPETPVPPPGEPPAPPAEAEAAPEPRRRVLPIEAVLATLRAENPPAPVAPQDPTPALAAAPIDPAPALPAAPVVPAATAVPAAPATPAAPAAPAMRDYWDFMNDEPPVRPAPPAPPVVPAEPSSAPISPAAVLFESTAPEPEPEPEPAPVFAPAPAPPRPPRTPWVRKAVASAAARLWPIGEPRPWVVIGAACVIAASVALLLTLLAGPSPDAATERLAPLEAQAFPAPEASPAEGDANAFVTASVLSCRTGPAKQARRVRNLGRGDAVRILARDGEWVSLAHRGAQCWALARFVSTQKPL